MSLVRNEAKLVIYIRLFLIIYECGSVTPKLRFTNASEYTKYFKELTGKCDLLRTFCELILAEN
jgi:hypothetical protein